jgi:hypothetical protein
MSQYSPADESDPVDNGSGAALQNEVRELTWSLIDEQISEEGAARLETLLTTSDEARANYLNCIELHVDLLGHFGRLPSAVERPAPARSPVLGFLNAGMPPLGIQPPHDASK